MFLQTPVSTFHKIQLKLTRHETKDLFDQVSRNGPHSFTKNTSVEFKSRRLVSREAGFSKSVEVRQFFGSWPLVLLQQHGITTTFRKYSAMRDDLAAEAKSVLGDNTIFGPIHDAKISLQFGRYGIDVQIDYIGGDGWKSWVTINRGLDRCITDISAWCKQLMYPETATREDASSCNEKSVTDETFT